MKKQIIIIASAGIAMLLSGCIAPQLPVAWSPKTALAERKTQLKTLVKKDNPGRLAALEAILEADGVAYEIQEFTAKDRKTKEEVIGKNLIVSLGSDDDEIPHLVIGAHYDAVRLKDGTMSDGAYDNGAAVLTLVDVIQTLKTQPLPHPVRVVFFDREESGLGGSSAYIQKTGKEQIYAAITLDIAAWGDVLMFGSTGDTRSGFLHQGVREVCAAQQIRAVEFPNFPPSDHRSFIGAEIPVVIMAAAPELDAHQFWLHSHGRKGLEKGFSPPQWQDMHSAGDQYSRVDPKTMAMIHNMVVALVLHIELPTK